MKHEMKLLIAPVWEQLDAVHEESRRFFLERGFPPEDVDKFAMISCELVENSLKYGDFRDGKSDVELAVRILRKQVIISAVNPVGTGSKPYLQELDRTIQWVRGFQDPYEAYLERMREISAEPFESSKSGLGLARITYEGQAVIDFFINEENVLAVSAVSQVHT